MNKRRTGVHRRQYKGILVTLEGLAGMEGGLEYTDKRTRLYW